MWRSRRRAAALLPGAGILFLPFLRIRGESALRFDLPTLRLHFFGAVLWVEEFHLLLFGLPFLLVLGLAVTVTLGRIWCGWLCPQTAIALLADWAAAVLQQPAVSFSVQWERRGAAPAANVYRYSVRNGTAEPLSLVLATEGALLLGDPRIAVPPGSRITGRVTVAAAEPAPAEIRITATGGRLRLGETAAFP